MKDKEWFAYYDEHKEKFAWFIKGYFNEDTLPTLDSLRRSGDRDEMTIILNDIWFLLPDNSFNIIENPPGWHEFLNLIEE